MNVESFEEEYKYYIEHACGLRRNSRDWDPKDCQKIQYAPTLTGDCNEDLYKTMSQWKISNSGMQTNLISLNHGINYVNFYDLM